MTNAETVTVLFAKDTTMNWSKDPEINKLFTHSVKNYMNDKLRSRGHVFLNELFDELGVPRTRQGQIVGWHISHNNPIEYASYEPKKDGAIELSIIPDGDILNKIESDS